ncbi:hypothetical protein COOONC_03574 [Cooperia oncophora]
MPLNVSAPAILMRLKEETLMGIEGADGKGIRPSPNKLKAILNMPEPRILKDLESYLGMIQYYKEFTQDR